METPNNVHLLTGFSCCEDFEKFLAAQPHENRKILDSLTAEILAEWSGKACNMAIIGTNLCLLDKDGVTLAYTPVVLQDGDTITRDDSTGKVSCVKIKAQGANKSVGLWFGTTQQYAGLQNKAELAKDTAFFFADINLYDVNTKLNQTSAKLEMILSGTTRVPYASSATSAKTATKATNATNADTATNAVTLNNGGLVFGRSLLWKFTHLENFPDGRKLPLDGSETTFDISGVSSKFIVVEIRAENGEIYGTQTYCKVRTPAFNCKGAQKETMSWRYKYKVNDTFAVEFRCDGDNKLCVRRAAGSPNDDNLYIMAIYEEL